MPTSGRVKRTNAQLPAAAVVADPFIVVRFCPVVTRRGGKKKSHSVRSTGEPSHGGGAWRRLCSEACGAAVRSSLNLTESDSWFEAAHSRRSPPSRSFASALERAVAARRPHSVSLVLAVGDGLS